MKQLEAIHEALRKLRAWSDQGKLNAVYVKHLQTVLKQRLENIDYRRSA